MLSALQEFFDDLVVIYASTVQSVKKFGESLLQVHVAFLYRTHARCVSETCGEGWKHNAFLTKKIQTQRRSVVMGADNKNKDKGDIIIITCHDLWRYSYRRKSVPNNLVEIQNTFF